MISVFVIDDDILACKGFESILAGTKEITCSGMAHSCGEAIGVIASVKTDLIVPDLYLS
jgi:response regulator of citrate/malate metabolism